LSLLSTSVHLCHNQQDSPRVHYVGMFALNWL
jgi:hypothetical protein